MAFVLFYFCLHDFQLNLHAVLIPEHAFAEELVRKAALCIFVPMGAETVALMFSLQDLLSLFLLTEVIIETF